MLLLMFYVICYVPLLLMIYVTCNVLCYFYLSLLLFMFFVTFNVLLLSMCWFFQCAVLFSMLYVTCNVLCYFQIIQVFCKSIEWNFQNRREIARDWFLPDKIYSSPRSPFHPTQSSLGRWIIRPQLIDALRAYISDVHIYSTEDSQRVLYCINEQFQALLQIMFIFFYWFASDVFLQFFSLYWTVKKAKNNY